jgi:hypothetical protein
MMDTTTISAERAGRLVEARLDRLPQDMLEAAVVLEAWAGVPAGRALDAGRELMAVRTPEREKSAGALRRRRCARASPPRRSRSCSPSWRSPAGRRRWRASSAPRCCASGCSWRSR